MAEKKSKTGIRQHLGRPGAERLVARALPTDQDIAPSTAAEASPDALTGGEESVTLDAPQEPLVPPVTEISEL
ncbi:MAG: hypothetical protein MK080_08440 [Opitutales bacterium]|nr:hypothetical protein [Opitutales bacterium]NRA25969.1 hypothetical protein [Opitutales bacterium]